MLQQIKLYSREKHLMAYHQTTCEQCNKSKPIFLPILVTAIKNKKLKEEKSQRVEKKRKYAAVSWAIPLSAAAIREHNVKCHSRSVSSAALSQEKAKSSGGEEKRRVQWIPSANPVLVTWEGRSCNVTAGQLWDSVQLSCNPTPIREGKKPNKIWFTGNMH